MGPLSGTVAIASAYGSDKTPEILDNGGIIARRIIQIADREADLGAMFLRQFLTQQYEEQGDGTATAAVIFQEIFDRGVRFISAGGNSMLLRQYLEHGRRLILEQLGEMSVQISGKQQISAIAETLCYDQSLANILGEIMDIIGEYGQFDIRPGKGRDLEREYVEGLYYENSGLFSRLMINDKIKLRAELHNPAFLISDQEIDDPSDVVPILKQVLEAKIKNLVIMARKMSEKASGILITASREPDKFQAIAVKIPGLKETDQLAVMQDLAILLGGTPVMRIVGQSLANASVKDLGYARRVWADENFTGIIGGKGDPRKLRRHLADLRLAHQNTKDQETRTVLSKRIGKLLGGSATLYIGAATEIELKGRMELAQRTSNTLRSAIRQGVLPGGGSALLACQPALKKRLSNSTSAEERAAYHILLKAIEAPFRSLVVNAGFQADSVMAELKSVPPGYGFDVLDGSTKDMLEAGIMDAAGVQSQAVGGAIASAALALTVDTQILHRKSKTSINP
jgi:chaperonin GroEL